MYYMFLPVLCSPTRSGSVKLLIVRTAPDCTGLRLPFNACIRPSYCGSLMAIWFYDQYLNWNQSIENVSFWSVNSGLGRTAPDCTGPLRTTRWPRQVTKTKISDLMWCISFRSLISFSRVHSISYTSQTYYQYGSGPRTGLRRTAHEMKKIRKKSKIFILEMGSHMVS